jgi:TonB family protein
MIPRRALAVFLLVPLMAAPLSAQKVLMADNIGAFTWVQAARGSDPCISIGGVIKPIESRDFILKDVPEYLPMFVSVKHINVRGEFFTTLSGTGSFNNQFLFDATFESLYRLKNVFLVIDIKTETGEKALFLSEVGELEPNREKSVSAKVPLASNMGKGIYHLHIFSDGIEVLQSTIPFDVQSAALDRMVARRIKDVHAEAPRLFVAATPDYPESLKSSNVKGQATVGFRIGPNGAVYNPVVKSATDPAFGDAALAAVRVWRFLPAVKDDAAVGVDVVIPVVFDQPKPTKA